MKNVKYNKGITLIALIITIIILLILAGVAISSLTENGLFEKAKSAKEVQMQTEMREQLVLALSELQVDKKGDATIDDVTQEWVDSALEDYEPIITDDEETNGKIITMTKSGVVVNYIIDEKINITKTEEIAGAQLTYEIKSIDGKNIQVNVIITDNVNGLKTIEYINDSHIQEANGLKTVSRDCTIQVGVEYKIKITSQDGTVKEETILLEEAKEIKITDEINVSLAQTAKIETTLNPSNAIAEIKWTIEDETIAELNNGEIKGLTAGTTTVTATIELQDGTIIQDTCEVNVYQKVTVINTAEELRAFAQEVNAGNSFEYELVKLGKDIALEGKEEDETTWWTPIGYYNSDTDYSYFKGTFDGQKHEISGIYIDNSEVASLFYRIGGATIKNLGITNSYFNGAEACSLVNAIYEYSNIINCYCKESTIIGNIYASGIVNKGYYASITMSNCYNSSEIYLNKIDSSDSYGNTSFCAGGIFGYLAIKGSFIENCYNIGNITVTQSKTGGLLHVGGLTGRVDTATFKNSYNAGNIIFAQTTYSGIIAGVCNIGAKIQNCYSLDSVANMDGIGLCNFVDGGGSLINCSALTDTYMKSQDFVNDLNNGETEGELAWKLNPNGGYPLLWWQ